MEELLRRQDHMSRSPRQSSYFPLDKLGPSLCDYAQGELIPGTEGHLQLDPGSQVAIPELLSLSFGGPVQQWKDTQVTALPSSHNLGT